MQLQNVNTSRYLEIENDILKRGIKMSNNHIQDIIDSVLPQISFKSNKVLIPLFQLYLLHQAQEIHAHITESLKRK